MYHGKIMIVDEQFVSVGSTNFIRVPSTSTTKPTSTSSMMSSRDSRSKCSAGTCRNRVGSTSHGGASGHSWKSGSNEHTASLLGQQL